MKCLVCGFDRFQKWEDKYCCFECHESDGKKHSVPCEIQQTQRAKGMLVR